MRPVPAPAIPDPTRNHPSRRELILGAGLVLAIAALFVRQVQPFDPYRPGTSHRTTVTMRGCNRAYPLYLDGRSWSSRDQPPANWPNPWTDGQHPGADIDGSLAVTDTDEATFTADIGGSAHYHRLGPNALPSLECPIA